MSNKSEQKIKVKVVSIGDDGHLECSHVTSRLKYGAICPKHMAVDIGQIVVIEFKSSGFKKIKGTPVESSYVVVDTLMDEVTATVLKAQHLVSDGRIYTSIILENIETKKRLHSLIDNTNKLFNDSTSTLIEGDNVKLFINNGEIFKIASLDKNELDR
jgi:hypothetical protein